MYAKAMFIGRIAKKMPYTFEDGTKGIEFFLGVKRNYPNLDGKYETDFFNFKVKDEMKNEISLNCEKGDLIAVSARIQTKKVFIDEYNFHYETELIIESITFLAQALTSYKNV